MELMHRYSRLKQHVIAERYGDLDESLVSRDRRGPANRSMLNQDPKIDSGFHQAICYPSWAAPGFYCVEPLASLTQWSTRIEVSGK